MSVGIRVRFEVLKRDGFRCLYCGQSPPAVVLQVDHVIPVSKGGTDDIGNLASSCRPCNIGKSNIPLEEIKDTPADGAARQSIASGLAKKAKSALEEQRRLVDAALLLDEYCRELDGRGDGDPYPWEMDAYMKFLRKLPFEELIDAIEITLEKGPRYGFNIRYFCGVCWRKVNEPELRKFPNHPIISA